MHEAVRALDGDEEDAVQRFVGTAVEEAEISPMRRSATRVLGSAWREPTGIWLPKSTREKPGAVRFMARYSSRTASMAARQSPARASFNRSTTRSV